jgi:hypothetical protein
MSAATSECRGGQGARGVVLLAGNGHVRRDIGVPRWLGDGWRDRLFSVGYLERSSERGGSEPAAAFDAVVQTAPATRADPCAGFGEHSVPAGAK